MACNPSILQQLQNVIGCIVYTHKKWTFFHIYKSQLFIYEMCCLFTGFCFLWKNSLQVFKNNIFKWKVIKQWTAKWFHKPCKQFLNVISETLNNKLFLHLYAVITHEALRGKSISPWTGGPLVYGGPLLHDYDISRTNPLPLGRSLQTISSLHNNWARMSIMAWMII